MNNNYLEVRRSDKGMEDGSRLTNKTARIFFPQFQGLRAVAFCAIFLCHTGIGKFGCLGAWGVSVFLVLSGFLMTVNYWEREIHESRVSFVWRKIKKLYPLHLVTMMGMALIHIYSILIGFEEPRKLIVDILLHSALVQVWIPFWHSTLNDPAWYLCVCVFVYALFPTVLRYIRNISKEKIVAFLVLSLFLEVGFALIAYCFGSTEKEQAFSAQRLTYFFPVSRLPDFLIGCCLGGLYQNQLTVRLKSKAYVWSEIAVLILLAMSLWIYANKIGILGSEYVRYTLLFIPTTAGLIWLLTADKGCLKTILSNSLLVKIGDYSAYGFLIHFPVINYSQRIMEHIDKGNNILTAVIAAVGTIACIWMWNRCTALVHNGDRKKCRKK